MRVGPVPVAGAEGAILEPSEVVPGPAQIDALRAAEERGARARNVYRDSRRWG